MTNGRPRALSRDEARAARKKWNDGFTVSRLAELYGVSRPTMTLVVYGKGVYENTL